MNAFAHPSGLLGTGFGLAHARIYHTHPQVSDVVVFGRTPAKLQAFADDFGYATTTDLASIYNDATIDLVDVCLPTRLHAEHVIRALAAGKHVLCELPLAATMDDARRILDAHAASDRQVFVDMFGHFDPANQFLHARRVRKCVHAACRWYSWRSPPSRSHRLTFCELASTTGRSAGGFGGSSPSDRWGR